MSWFGVFRIEDGYDREGITTLNQHIRKLRLDMDPPCDRPHTGPGLERFLQFMHRFHDSQHAHCRPLDISGQRTQKLNVLQRKIEREKIIIIERLLGFINSLKNQNVIRMVGGRCDLRHYYFLLSGRIWWNIVFRVRWVWIEYKCVKVDWVCVKW